MQLLGFLIFFLVVVFLAWHYVYRSKQKMKEVELRLLSRYRDLFNNMPLPYIRQRLIREGTQIDVQVLDVNHAFEEKIAPKDFVVNKRGNWRELSFASIGSAYGFREWKILHL